MDRLSYERRREDEKRRFVRFTLPGGLFIYVDRSAIMAFGTDLEGNTYLLANGASNIVQENIIEVKALLGIDRERSA